MDFEIDRLEDMWSQSNHCGVETFEVSDLQNRVAAFGGLDHPVRFFKRSRDGFFDENVNADFEQAAGNLAMSFGWDRDAGGIDAAGKRAPVSGPLSLSVAIDRAGCFFVQVANRDEFRAAFGCEVRMDAGVLFAEATNSYD